MTFSTGTFLRLVLYTLAAFTPIHESLSQSRSFDEPVKGEIIEALEAFHKRYRLTSLSFSIFQGQTEGFDYATGYANKAEKIKATPDHIYTIASLTKPVTAMTLVDLVNRNYLALGDSVHKFIAGFTRGITVLDLLNHTSGFLREKENEHFLSNSSYLDVVEYLPVKFKLKIHRYANFNYAAVGALIDKMMKKEYSAVANDYYLSVTGDSLYFSNHQRYGSDPRFVKNYVRRGRRLHGHDVVNFGLWEPAAFAQASARSLARFLRAQMTPQLIGLLESHAVTVKKRKNRSGHTIRDCYALGFRLRYIDGDLHYIYHNGFLYGVLGTLYYFPKKDLGFVALSNMSYYPRQRVAIGSLYKRIETIVDDAFNDKIARYAARNGYVAGAIFYETNRELGEISEQKLSSLAQDYLDNHKYREAFNLYKFIRYFFPDSKASRDGMADAYRKLGNDELTDEILLKGGGMESSDTTALKRTDAQN
ncbi:MAG: serine hydrolase domain-containing protein [bacterium]